MAPPLNTGKEVDVIILDDEALLYSPDGIRYSVPITLMQDMLDEGFTPVPAEVVRFDKTRERVAQASPWLTGPLSFVSGSSMMIAPLIAKAIGPQAQDALNAVEEKHPYLNIAGNVTGLLGAGGAGAALRGAVGGAVGGGLAGAAAGIGTEAIALGSGLELERWAETNKFEPGNILRDAAMIGTTGAAFEGAAGIFRAGRDFARKYAATKAQEAITTSRGLEKQFQTKHFDLIGKRSALLRAVDEKLTPEVRKAMEGISTRESALADMEIALNRMIESGVGAKAIAKAKSSLDAAKTELELANNSLSEQSQFLMSKRDAAEAALANLGEWADFRKVAKAKADLTDIKTQIEGIGETAIGKRVAELSHKVDYWKGRAREVGTSNVQKELTSKIGQIKAGIGADRAELSKIPTGVEGVSVFDLDSKLGSTIEAIGKQRLSMKPTAAVGDPSFMGQMLNAVAKTTPSEKAAFAFGYLHGGFKPALASVIGLRAFKALVPVLGPKVKALGRGAVEAGRVSNMRTVAPVMLSKLAFDGYERKLSDDNMEMAQGELEQDAQQAIAFGMDPQGVEAVKRLKLASMQFLKEKLPQPRKVPPSKDVRSIIQKPYTPTPGERYQFGKYVKTIENPSSLVDDFTEGGLTKEAVETWERLYPQALAEFRDLVKESLYEGAQFTRAEIRQMNVLMAVPEDQGLLKILQDNHLASAENEQQKQSAPSGAISESWQTPIQKILGG